LRTASWRSVLSVLLSASGLVLPSLRAEGPIISEFMTSNLSTLQDEDGEYHDWIEIHNPTASPVNLAGYSLSDNQLKPDLWKFPDLTLEAGKFLVVFASQKDRVDPAANLHTNFKLADRGFLGLFAPDGTPASVFAPQYPSLVSDVSYGAATETVSTLLVAAGAQARALVPLDGGLGTTWMATGFDDSSWTQGSTGVGFDLKPLPTYTNLILLDVGAAMQKKSTSAYLRIPFTVPEGAAYSGLLLRVKYDAGFVAFLNGKEVARRNAPTTSITYSSHALARRREGDALDFETVNLSAKVGLLTSGQNVLAIQGLDFTKTDLAFVILPELEAVEAKGIQQGVFSYFTIPTPGGVNLFGSKAIADPPFFSQESGSYTESFSLTLLSSAPDAEIHYTTDRTEPKKTSPIYTDPIPIDNSTVVRARAYVPDPLIIPSPALSATYFILDSPLGDFSSNLPLAVGSTFGAQVSTVDTQVSLEFIDTPAHGGRTTLTDSPNFVGKAAIHIRGSSSQQFPKKQFRLKLEDDQGNQVAVPLLGLPKDADWHMYAPYDDKTLMRDVISYRWSNLIGTYAPRSRYFELYLSTSSNGKVRASDYLGVYVLLERIKRSKDRVDVEKLYRSYTQEPEITGGYILKKDRPGPGDIGLITPHGQTLYFVSPDEGELKLAPEQHRYITKFFSQMDSALYGVNFKNPDTGYKAWIDVPAFIDHHIMVELTKNIDGFRLSTFMFKDREGKLHMGPIWDYNLCLGNANYNDGWKPDGWYYRLLGDGDYPFYPRLFQDPDFAARYRTRWIEIRKNFFHVDTLRGQIDETAQLLAEAEARDNKKWQTLGVYVWPNQFIGKTYPEEINWMKDWVSARVEWMDSQFLATPTFSQAGAQLPTGFQLTITGPPGAAVYYTQDSSDPRLPNGDMNSSALLYQGPIAINSNTRVRARAFQDAIWSARKDGSYLIGPQPVVITEIMYRPQDPPAGSLYTADDFEFIELKNTGSVPVSLKGYRFSAGITFDFTKGTVDSLLPGAYLVVVRNRAAFESRYGTDSIQVAGEYTGDLSNNGESLTLLGSLDETVHKFTYLPAWYPDTADGSGHSLTIVDPSAPRETWGAKESWRSSTAVGGSPGAGDNEPPPSGAQRPADLNQDGRVNLTDVIVLLNRLVGGSTFTLPCDGGDAGGPGNTALLDIDGDRSVNLTDAIYLLNYLFARGPAPALGKACARIRGCPDACH
jgi:hypothetical protein